MKTKTADNIFNKTLNIDINKDNFEYFINIEDELIRNININVDNGVDCQIIVDLSNLENDYSKNISFCFEKEDYKLYYLIINQKILYIVIII